MDDDKQLSLTAWQPNDKICYFYSLSKIHVSFPVATDKFLPFYNHFLISNENVHMVHQ